MCHEKDPIINLDPLEKRSKLLSAYGVGFRGGESCYYTIVPQNAFGNETHDFYVDMNVTQVQGLTIKVINGTDITQAGTIDLVDEAPALITREAINRSYPNRLYPNQVFIMVTTDPNYGGNPLFLLEISLRLGDKYEDIGQEGGEGDDIVDFFSNSTYYASVPIVIVEALASNKQLTLSEKSIILAIVSCAILKVVKEKFCPNSWGFKDPKSEKKLLAK